MSLLSVQPMMFQQRQPLFAMNSAETAGSVAYSTPSETAGSVACSAPAASSGCGSSFNAVA